MKFHNRLKDEREAWKKEHEQYQVYEVAFWLHFLLCKQHYHVGTHSGII
jgi:hypothetical protein